MDKKQISKNVRGVVFGLMSQSLYEKDGVLYKESYWLEGFGEDVDNDGKIGSHILKCRVPDGYDDLDLATLDESCLFDNGEGRLVYQTKPD